MTAEPDPEVVDRIVVLLEVVRGDKKLMREAESVLAAIYCREAVVEAKRVLRKGG